MKDVDTLQKRRKWLPDNIRWRLWSLMAFLLLTGKIVAQTVSWENGTPDFPSSLLTVSDEAPLDIEFTPLGSDVTDAKLKVTIPAGLKYDKVQDGSAHTTGITYSVNPVGNASTGYTVTISFTSNNSKLIAGQKVHLQVLLTPECTAVAGTVTVETYTGDTLLGTEKTIDYTVQTPEILTSFDQQAIYFEESEQSTKKTVELSLSALYGEVSSFKLQLTYSTQITLEEFKLGTEETAVTPTITTSGSTRTATFNFTEDILGSKLNGTAKKLTFKAGGAICGTYAVKVSSIQFPVTNPCFSKTDELPDLTLVFKGEEVVPTLSFVGATYVNGTTNGPDLNVGISTYLVNMDGVTPTYHRVVYKNGNVATAHNIKQTIDCYRITTGIYNYVETSSPIYYSLDGGGTIVEVPTANIFPSIKLQDYSSIRTLKSGMGDKTARVQVSIPGSLEKNGQLMIYYPIAGGNIYDNSNLGTSTLLSSLLTTLNWHSYSISSTNSCGKVGGAPTNTYGYTGYNFPRIPDDVPALTYGQGQTGESEFYLYTGANGSSMGSGQSITIFAKLPDWLTLDHTDLSSFTYKNTNPVSITQGLDNTYSITIQENGVTIPVKISYKSVDNYDWNGATKASDQIRFWVDWKTGDGSELKYFTQLYQDVQLVKDNGLVLEDFSLNRTTVGWKDSNKNGIRDDMGSLPTGIDHNTYLLNDEGEMIVEGHVTTSGLSSYDYLYMVFSSTSLLNGTELSLLNNARIKLSINDGADILLTLQQNTNYQYYLAYKPGTPLVAGDKIKATVEFQVKKTINAARLLNVEGYISNTELTSATAICNPSSSDRYGEYKLGQQIKTYTNTYYGVRAATTFTGTTLQSGFTFPGHSVFHDTPMLSPRFENEIRNMDVPTKLVIEMPSGYQINSDLTVKITSGVAFVNESKTVQATKTESAASTVYTYDLADLFKENYHDGNIISDKWPYLNNKFVLSFAADVQATKGAVSPAVVKTTLSHIGSENSTDIPRNFNVYYTGDRTMLEAKESLKAYSSELVLTPVRVTNPNSFDTNIWLYIEGPAENFVLTDLGTNAPSGTTSGSWIALGEITQGTTMDYSLGFAYKGLESSVTDKNLRIYTVSNFQEVGWSPNTGQGLEQFSSDDYLKYVGANQQVTVLSATSKISGELSLDNNILDPGDLSAGYQLSALLDGRASAGLLVDPSMEITIPAGQKYVAGSVKIEYPIGTILPFNSTLDALLQTRNSDLENTFNFTFQMSDAFPGNLAPNCDVTKQQAILTAKFTADACDTDLSLSSFKGVLSGENAAGSAAAGTGRELISKKLSVKSDYRFNVELGFADNAPVVYEGSVSKNLQISITKVGGAASPINSKDSLQITFDTKLLDFQGTDIALTAIGMSVPATISTFENVENGTKRIITIPLPKNSYDVDGEKGTDKKVTFTLPVTYTLTDDDFTLDPEKRIDASVISPMDLGCTTPGTTQQFGSLGENSIYMAVVRPDANPLLATVGTEAVFEIASPGFEGRWYSAATGNESDALTAADVYAYTFTPTAANDDVTYYVSAIFPGGSYGMIPVKAKIYPAMDVTALNATICSGESQDLTSLVTVPAANTHADFILKYYSDENGTSPLLSTTVSPTAASTPYYVRQETTDGLLKGTMATITIAVLTKIENLTITPASPATVDFGGSTTLSVSHTGDVVLYQWYKDNVLLTGANASSYPITNADPAAHNGEYHVVLTGCNVETSSKVKVQVRPANVTLTSGAQTVFCRDDAELISGKTLISYIETGSASLSYVYNTDDGTSFATVSGIKIPNTAGIYNYYLKADSMGVQSATATPLRIVVNELLSFTTNLPSNEQVLDNGTVLNLEVTVAGSPRNADNKYVYQLFKEGDPIAIDTEETTAQSHTFALGNQTVTGETTYYIQVTGACAYIESNHVKVTVCPSVDVTGISAQLIFCETDMQAGVLLTSQFTEVPGLEYYYNTDGGNTYTTSVTGVELPKSANSPSGLTYYIKAKNQKGTYSTSAAEIKVTVEKKTTISKVDGYEVTEGNAIDIIVIADGEGTLSYEWYEEGNNTPLTTTLTSTYRITPSASIAADNGKKYRVVVKGSGSCGEATHSFTLKVNSSTTPPLGNNKVTWDVIGYGNAVVTADGLSISNGSHVNNGTKLGITGTTWLSNVLKSITVNGTEYNTSSVSYTVNGENVHIVVEFLGSDPNPDPNSNTEIGSSTRIWTEGGYACIYTETISRARIVTFNGRMVTDQKLPAGESRIQLPDGYYILTLSDGTTKKIAVRNF